MNTTTSQNFRFVEIDGEPWFFADIACSILGLGNNARARRTHLVALLTSDERRTINVADVEANGAGRAMLISANGLGKLLMLSERPSAKKVKDYVATVVVPTILELGITSVEEFAIDGDTLESLTDKAADGLADGVLAYAIAVAWAN